MGQIKNLAKSLIFIDTAPLIYFIEEHPRYASVLESLFIADKYIKPINRKQSTKNIRPINTIIDL